MAAKKKTTSSKTTTTTATETLKFTKGAFYQDQTGTLWCCANGKVKTVGDLQVVMMQQTEDGQAVGDATEQRIDAFAKQLTTAELKEYREVCQREREAEEAAKTTPAPTKKTRSAKTTADGDEQPKAKKGKPASDEPKPKKLSALDAAAKVLGEATEPMGTKEMIDAMSAKGYWTSPGGQTPHATLYAAILREINVKGVESRFVKTDRGRFGLAVLGERVGDSDLGSLTGAETTVAPTDDVVNPKPDEAIDTTSGDESNELVSETIGDVA